jgi:NADH dehydrogenase/putative oxidoreductase
MAVSTELFQTLSRLAWPLLDLGIRLWLAQRFFVSGVVKLTHWSSALDLAATEYPVRWMDPVTAACTGVTIEVAGAVLLASGLLTRYAAVPMLILTLVVRLNYQAVDSQLFWVVLLGWYAVAGAGPLSLDNVLRRGISDSALPVAPSVLRVSAWLRRQASPFYLSFARLWFAATLLVAATGGLGGRLEPGAAWLPLQTAAHWPGALALAVGGFLLPGLLTRAVSVGLVLALLGVAMRDPRLSDDIYALMVLAILIAQGGGPVSLDAIARSWYATRVSGLNGARRTGGTDLPRVVIVGAGFGGLSCAAALRHARASVTLIDRANYHLFQPLLYQVATAALSPGDIAAPVRPLFRDAANTRVLLGAVTGVDATRKVVMLGGKEVPYDHLVLATGAAHSYFGKDHWAPFAPGLKRVEDATEIRRRLLTAFELAEATDDEAERKALLTFLIVGGGPTGVELAGAIAELARFGMEKEFRRFDPASARVLLVQSAPRLLPAFPEQLAAIAHRSLERLGVEVQTGSRVEHIDAQGVTVSGNRISARTVLWAAGVKASPAAEWLQVAGDTAGRVKVDEYLRVIGVDNVYAIGDTALSLAWKGQPVPGLAPAAKQGGVHVARVIRRQLAGKAAPPAFSYRHLGSLATIGRKSAVADFGAVRLWGAPAWWLWGLVHIGFLVGVRNRVSTVLNWFWTYLTFGGGIRLITGSQLRE